MAEVGFIFSEHSILIFSKHWLMDSGSFITTQMLEYDIVYHPTRFINEQNESFDSEGFHLPLKW